MIERYNRNELIDLCYQTIDTVRCNVTDCYDDIRLIGPLVWSSGTSYRIVVIKPVKAKSERLRAMSYNKGTINVVDYHDISKMPAKDGFSPLCYTTGRMVPTFSVTDKVLYGRSWSPYEYVPMRKTTTHDEITYWHVIPKYIFSDGVKP